MQTLISDSTMGTKRESNETLAGDPLYEDRELVSVMGHEIRASGQEEALSGHKG